MLTAVDKFQMLIGSAQLIKMLYFMCEVKEMKINEKIYSLRKEHNLSQEELADKLNVSRQTVSKWELGDSCPDFDKIVPLCKVFGISPDELLQDKKNVEKVDENKPDTKKALLICTSIFLYFIAIVSIILGEEYLNLNEGVTVSIFLIICSIATVIIVFTCMTRPSRKNKKENKEKIKDPVLKNIVSIITLLTTCIYLLISFLTMAWHITWIIWIIYSIIIKIVELIYGIKEEETNEE